MVTGNLTSTPRPLPSRPFDFSILSTPEQLRGVIFRCEAEIQDLRAEREQVRATTETSLRQSDWAAYWALNQKIAVFESIARDARMILTRKGEEEVRGETPQAQGN